MLSFGKKDKSVIFLTAFNWSVSDLSSVGGGSNNEKQIVREEVGH